MEYILWFIVIVAAYFVKAVAGFGNSPIHTGIMALSKNNADLTPVDFVLTVPANVTLLIKYRKYLDKKLWVPGAVITALTAVPGALLLKNTDSRTLKVVCGVVILLLGVDMLARRKDGGDPPPEWLTLTLIAVSGVINSLFGIGVLLAAVMGRVIHDTKVLKANITAMFVTGNVVTLIMYIATGLLTGDVLLRAFSLYPAMGLGLWAGFRCVGRLREQTVRACTAVVLIFCGAMLIAGNIHSLLG